MNKPIQSKSFDTLLNLVSGLGILGKDKNVSTQYTFTPLTRSELDSAYRSDWVARKCVDVPAHDSTREWRAWQADKKDITKIEDEEKRLGLQRKVKRAIIRARLYGGGALLMGVDGEPDMPLEPKKIPVGGLKYLHYFSCNELVAGEIDWDPESEFYGEPTYYRFSSLKQGAQVEVHPSRIIRFVGSELPDRSLSSNIATGWGDSIIQTIDDAVKHVGLAAQGIGNLLHEAKLDIVSMPNFSAMTTTAEMRSRLFDRFQAMNIMKSMLGVTVLDANDKWDRKEVTFAGLDRIVEMYMLLASGAVDIPATRLFGRTPAGLNATGESDLRNYYDRIKSEQATEITPTMERLDRIVMQSAFGQQLDGVWYEWNPLWQQTPDEKAKEALAKAQVFQIDVAAALIPEDALREGRENQLIEDGTYPGLEQAIEDAELAAASALNELDPQVQEQAKQHLLAQKAGVPMLPPPGPQNQPPGPGGQQNTNQPPPPRAGDAISQPRDRDGTYALGLSPGEARRRRLRDIANGRVARRKTRMMMEEAGWSAGGAITEHGRNILQSWPRHDDDDDWDSSEGTDFNACHDPHTGAFCSEGGAMYQGHLIEGKENKKGKVRFHVTTASGIKLGKSKTLAGAKELVHANIEKMMPTKLSAARLRAMFNPPQTALGKQVSSFIKYNPGGRFLKKDAATANDMEPTPLYVRRDLVNKSDLLSWAKAQNIPVDAPDELHVTVLYSREPVDWFKMGESNAWDRYNSVAGVKIPEGGYYVAPGGPRAVEQLMPSGAIVLQFSSTGIQWRHAGMVAMGASHDYEDDYFPHITLTVDPSRSLSTDVEPYRGALIFGPEIFEEAKAREDSTLP